MTDEERERVNQDAADFFAEIQRNKAARPPLEQRRIKVTVEEKIFTEKIPDPPADKIYQ